MKASEFHQSDSVKDCLGTVARYRLVIRDFHFPSLL